MKAGKMAAVLACRNQSLRLYAKPLQTLDVKTGLTILDFLIRQLKQIPILSGIVLAISEKEENAVYRTVARRHEIPFVIGDDHDALGRLLRGAESVQADQVFRVTTESPYCYLDNLEEVYRHHCDNGLDHSVILGVPDGAYYEIIRYDALKKSWELGEKRHRSEFCTSYIHEHPDQFKIKKQGVPEEVRSGDVRLTVDWPEDLIVLRRVYEDLRLNPDKPVSIEKIIAYLRSHPEINALNNRIDSGAGRIWY
ncbi:MAG: acylneuraminate cytidylyltransferase [Deltaproteobacteria bacterium]|nr:acylneuraminate cytidylyltransferase [Deltaproteobacteria bacterium]